VKETDTMSAYMAIALYRHEFRMRYRGEAWGEVCRAIEYGEVRLFCTNPVNGERVEVDPQFFRHYVIFGHRGEWYAVRSMEHTLQAYDFRLSRADMRVLCGFDVPTLPHQAGYQRLHAGDSLMVH
jgi:hypothetical protein